MAWSDQIFRYCERGADGGFWAEPLNALSNGAFILAALIAGYELKRRGAREPAAVSALVILVFTIGIGSFLFHTLATRWAALADVVPIGLFMLAYLGYALRSFLALAWPWVALLLAAFVWTGRSMATVPCRALTEFAGLTVGPCLNGTLSYAPALIATLATAGALALRHHAAARLVALAAVVFLASMTFRTLDLALCDESRLFGRPLGMHALWHVLNATTLYLLLAAAIRHGGGPDTVASRRG